MATTSHLSPAAEKQLRADQAAAKKKKDAADRADAVEQRRAAVEEEEEEDDVGVEGDEEEEEEDEDADMVTKNKQDSPAKNTRKASKSTKTYSKNMPKYNELDLWDVIDKGVVDAVFNRHHGLKYDDFLKYKEDLSEYEVTLRVNDGLKMKFFGEFQDSFKPGHYKAALQILTIYAHTRHDAGIDEETVLMRALPGVKTFLSLFDEVYMSSLSATICAAYSPEEIKKITGTSPDTKTWPIKSVRKEVIRAVFVHSTKTREWSKDPPIGLASQEKKDEWLSLAKQSIGMHHMTRLTPDKGWYKKGNPTTNVRNIRYFLHKVFGYDYFKVTDSDRSTKLGQLCYYQNLARNRLFILLYIGALIRFCSSSLLKRMSGFPGSNSLRWMKFHEIMHSFDVLTLKCAKKHFQFCEALKEYLYSEKKQSIIRTGMEGNARDARPIFNYKGEEFDHAVECQVNIAFLHFFDKGTGNIIALIIIS